MPETWYGWMGLAFIVIVLGGATWFWYRERR
jgi:hypothetical protein